MQYTTNYNLITVEGTDVVNPLVQMNPNFTDIDAAMFANKQASIGTASEIVSGTVHAITRANPDSDYFKFTATGNWTSGDSMSVDGVNVSVYLTDGTTPGTGSYVINSEVFGMISGSRVTLFLSNNPVTSLDADQVTFDPTGTNLDPSDTDVDKAIKDLDNIVSSIPTGAVFTKLWENPNPAVAFPAQNISLSSADYDLLYWDFVYVSNSNYRVSQIIPKGADSIISLAATSGSTYTTNIQRNIFRISNTSYDVADAYTQNAGSARAVSNTYFVPSIIYGIKF